MVLPKLLPRRAAGSGVPTLAAASTTTMSRDHFARGNARSATTAKDRDDDMRRRPTMLALPDGVKWEDQLWEPTWEEKALAYHREQMLLALAAVKRIELLEQREWLLAATQRVIATALLIDETERKLALREEMDRTDKWWADTVKREQKQNEDILAAYQKIMDAPGKKTHDKMVERAKKTGEEIERSKVRLERLTLLSRGVVRGRRA